MEIVTLNYLELIELDLLEQGIKVYSYDEVLYFNKLLAKYNLHKCKGMTISGANPWFIKSVFEKDFELTAE